ncbi:hypothetical protein FHR83_008475 [Actinoplanes campanulatus]|uniref:Uncharacterized protein n=1 Tax=Actinoplanes campanulatus TaxID=113559 RepID=A0A7W5FJQ4_9ACTN|nr:hypothetical protein [Actinoplanes campanulatus]MBB3100750.1 hypothetical protein [Actinoplanes campanulatus]GGN46140.1 hypothetical protein GCM10010109_81040 [Actinoplanes campanulatus]GID41188.1 hypothetical protein Aca09nite_76940 [Actinoplanes campanulatus]
MSLFDAYGRAEGAAGLLTARGVDADGWHHTMLAGPDPGPLPVLSIEPGLHRRMTAAARRADGGATLSAASPIRRAEVTATNLHARYRNASPGGLDLLLTAHHARGLTDAGESPVVINVDGAGHLTTAAAVEPYERVADSQAVPLERLSPYI